MYRFHSLFFSTMYETTFKAFPSYYVYRQTVMFVITFMYALSFCSSMRIFRRRFYLFFHMRYVLLIFWVFVIVSDASTALHSLFYFINSFQLFHNIIILLPVLVRGNKSAVLKAMTKFPFWV